MMDMLFPRTKSGFLSAGPLVALAILASTLAMEERFGLLATAYGIGLVVEFVVNFLLDKEPA